MTQHKNSAIAIRICQIPMLLLPLLFYLGCSTVSSSTGIITSANRKTLPPGIPQRVGVIPFKGDQEISLQASDQFTSGLPMLGFQVVERSQIEAVLGEQTFQQTDSIDPLTRERLGRLLGLQGVFLGSITGESSSTWVDSHLNIRLVSIETGDVVWAAEAHDPRPITLSMDIRTSAVYSVRQSLSLLRRDVGQ
jgi:curli biogenesis system outer membrane secretion channel CsgG